MRPSKTIGAVCILLLPALAFGQAMPAVTGTPTAGGGTQWSLSIQTLLLLTSLSFLPALLLMMTSFTRIIIVFSLLPRWHPGRAAQLGAGLLFFFVMAPVGERIYAQACRCRKTDRVFRGRGWRRAVALLLKHAGDRRCSRWPTSLPANVVRFPCADPAFVTSELKTGFQIGFIIFIPFIIIDMIVASVLMSMGMMMMSPVMVALPFKIMLFVLVDGWNLLIASLVNSFG
jgi:flagellar biosynthetic protein FliP